MSLPQGLEVTAKSDSDVADVSTSNSNMYVNTPCAAHVAEVSCWQAADQAEIDAILKTWDLGCRWLLTSCEQA
jgi:hypothetical protein